LVLPRTAQPSARLETDDTLPPLAILPIAPLGMVLGVPTGVRIGIAIHGKLGRIELFRLVSDSIQLGSNLKSSSLDKQMHHEGAVFQSYLLVYHVIKIC